MAMNVPPREFIRVPAEDLARLSRTLFEKAGMPAADAALVTELLIDTDLRGVLSHGTRLVNEYARTFLAGRLNPVPRIQVVRQEGATAVVDGDGGLGHLPAHRATLLAMAGARETGVGAAISRNHGHFGSAGKYARLALRHDCAALCVSGHAMLASLSGPPSWNPFGCPPMCFAFPGGKEAPIILDMGTSFYGEDHFRDLFASWPAPFFKSIGLVAAAHLLGGTMAGMYQTPFRPGTRRYEAAFYGAFICVFDIARFLEVEDFKAEVDRTVREARQVAPWPGQETYTLPGGPEWERERQWAREGIPLGEEHRLKLEEIAAALGVPVPW
jgi:LDH2 family malate/lactate/ureidoglycolate dehydrogenase